jgi:hypothetical protein
MFSYSWDVVGSGGAPITSAYKRWPLPSATMAQSVPSTGDVCSFVPDESVKGSQKSDSTPHRHTHDHGVGPHSHSHDTANSGLFTLAEHGHTHEHLEHAGSLLLLALHTLHSFAGFS